MTGPGQYSSAPEIDTSGPLIAALYQERSELLDLLCRAGNALKSRAEPMERVRVERLIAKRLEGSR